MKTGDLLRQALEQAHTYLEIKFGLCPADLLYEPVPGGTIAAIAPIYAHAVVNEDACVQRDVVMLHISEHSGEISAQLGVRGLKGSPWG